MSLLEDNTASFVVRIWREKGEYPNSAPEWRGMIEHVETGQSTFFRDFTAMLDFMHPYLECYGIDPSERFWERLESWTSAPEKPAIADPDASCPDVVAPIKPIPRQ
jgi:hypothetical protein